MSELPPGYRPWVTVALADLQEKEQRIKNLLKANTDLVLKNRVSVLRSIVYEALIRFFETSNLSPSELVREGEAILKEQDTEALRNMLKKYSRGE